jgi:AcrR family transcriptional regulator
MTQPAKKTNYHHGDLRQGLIDTALSILEQASPDDLSLRKMARHLGVSQTAVYSHFKDKTDLLAAIAAHGFQKQAHYIHDQIRDIREPYLRVEAFAVYYMRFAFEHRSLFQLMYCRDVQDIKSHRELSLSAGKSYGIFATAWSRFQPESAKQTPFIWSMIHGQTLLMCDPKFGPSIAGGRTPAEMARDSILIFKGA